MAAARQHRRQQDAPTRGPARRFHAPAVDRRRARGAAAGSCHGPGPRAAAAPLARAADRRLAGAGAGGSCGAVVRLAVPGARLGLDREPQPQHVDADLHRRASGLRLQRGCRAGARLVPARSHHARRRGRALFRGRRRHRRAGAGRPGAGAAGYMSSMQEATKASCRKRLVRIEGQVRGLARMVEDDRYCIDIVTQLSAVRAHWPAWSTRSLAATPPSSAARCPN